jgi:hypothetical protein
LTGILLPEQVLHSLLPKTEATFTELRATAAVNGWLYGRPRELPQQHLAILAVARDMLERLKVSRGLSSGLMAAGSNGQTDGRHGVPHVLPL